MSENVVIQYKKYHIELNLTRDNQIIAQVRQEPKPFTTRPVLFQRWMNESELSQDIDLPMGDRLVSHALCACRSWVDNRIGLQGALAKVADQNAVRAI